VPGPSFSKQTPPGSSEPYVDTNSMLCNVCENAFREDSEVVDESVNHLLPFSLPRPRYQTATHSSPFFKATHHCLPRLIQSASDGCRLCTFLWEAARLWDEALQNDRPAHWLPCYIIVDRAVFSTPQCAKKLLVEFKYQLGITDPNNYVQPIKRHFRLLWSEGICFPTCPS